MSDSKTDSLHFLLNQQIISPLSYFFAQFISQQSGEKIDSLLGQSAALVSECKQQGDVCINLSDYADTVIFGHSDNNQALGIKMPTIDIWIKALKSSSCVSSNFALSPLILDANSLYLGKLWHFEDALVKYIKQSLSQTVRIDTGRLKQGLKHLFKDDANAINWQKIAASVVVTKSFSIISGGPGTGKTTTLIKIIALLLEQDSNLKIQLCAPTGKAAIRMLEAINSRKNEINLNPNIIDKMPNTAQTIHRLLAYRQGEFTANKENPLNLDCLIIDEASMIDFELMFHLISALAKHCKLILVGDKDQLSSVSAGHVFSDLCGQGAALNYSKNQTALLIELNNLPQNVLQAKVDSPKIADAIALLKTSYRFNAKSGIARLAKLVNQGMGKAALALIDTDHDELDLILVKENELPKAAIEQILKHYECVIKAKTVEQAIRVFSQFQVLCALKKGVFGVKAINDLIDQRLQLRHKLNSIHEFNGLPILITQNDYENELFNGDIGILWKSSAQYLVYFQQVDGALKSYPLISLSHYEHAWAITVHKSQGSEYDHIVLILPNESEAKNLKRELIYTGITRAKLKFSLCSTANVFIKSCHQITKRSSHLARKLGWTIER